MSIDIVRKNIKNLHLGVYPPNGRVRVAAPLLMSNEAVRLAIISRLGWIKRQRAKFEEQSRQSERQYVSGESHYFLGQRYRLRVHINEGPARVALKGKTSIDLYVKSESSAEFRSRVFQRWHRDHLKALIPQLLEKWQSRLNVKVADWGIKRMKTKWGSCNVEARRIWLNLELVKKSEQCIEYIVVHELVHLIERHHSDRFTKLMDKHLPNWRSRKQELNSAPLAHDAWEY
ncbi:M48 family metallopeptidase [candidate division KSB1 bacterium]|nr:M48 family metallopeptidase [candidate division KSB1 bacterium]